MIDNNIQRGVGIAARTIVFGLIASVMIACGDLNSESEMAATTDVAPSNPLIARSGRVEVLDNGAVRFGFPGVSFKFEFTGSSLQLLASSEQGNSYLDIVVDGESSVINIPQNPTKIALLSGSAIGKHSVEIFNRSETWHGITTLSSIEVGQGTLLAKPALPERKILVIGDSITCGEAIESPAECGTKANDWWNPRLSYGMLMAAEFDAQAHLVCMGGHGLIRNWDGVTTDINAPVYYDLAIVAGDASVSWSQADYTPDLVYIALGTNDFSTHAGPIPSESDYVEPYIGFVKKILSDHPNTQVVLTEGPMLDGEAKAALSKYLGITKARVGSDQVHVVHAKKYPSGPCDFHPGKAEHAGIAADIIPPIKTIMGW
ncbi:SGNH/GDSL hydrolase family protein [Teredinibacter haidensis]|uniref:SGNH/GDSL hydrolase family protein n=1 Tax=Teredinibacter haidensis TaxID=2731755 RepID=UPI0009FB5108|nr:SGNH/GDSL hydrolase family protein [Teredinibacter haidensis]